MVESARLESVYAGNGIEGSNPSPSAVMVNFLFSPAIAWLSAVFFWVIFVFAVYAYSRRGRAPGYLQAFSKQLIKVTIGFYVLYAAFLTWGQYYVWSGNPLGRIFLISDRFGGVNDSFDYFLFYSYMRFWLSPALAILAAFLFYTFLRVLEKYRRRFFEDGETELGFLTALVSGWPQFVIFLPLVLAGVAAVALFRLVFLKERFTTMGWSFLVSLLLTLVWGGTLIEALNLGVLRI